MQELSMVEVEVVSGGIAYLAPAAIALVDTSALGPLGTAFGIGFAIGTGINYISDNWTGCGFLGTGSCGSVSKFKLLPR